MSESSFHETKVFVEGHGCSASMADTEFIMGMIEHDGLKLAEDEEDADLSILVTCTVKSVTEQRMLSRIRDLSDSGKKKLIVAGCLPRADPDKVSKLSPTISMIGPGNLDKILPAIKATMSGQRLVSLEHTKLVKVGMPRVRSNKVIGVVEISSGCLSSCTFCQVKLVKGVVFSYPENEIVNEASQLIADGAREIWLTSTDNAAYGRDSKTSLTSLVRKICALQGDFKVRIGMMNPLLTDRILEELIHCLKDEKVFKFIHIPVQSGNERILKAMQRGYTVEEFESIVHRLRREIPYLTLSTDMIVGFPTETDSEFEDSLELLKRSKPDILNLSRYGARPGTKAAVMNGQVKSEVAKSRSVVMTNLAKEIQNENNSRWIGWKGIVLIDEKVRNAVIGRNFAYKPCLLKDAEVCESNDSLGMEMEVSVLGATASTLRAELVRSPPTG